SRMDDLISPIIRQHVDRKQIHTSRQHSLATPGTQCRTCTKVHFISIYSIYAISIYRVLLRRLHQISNHSTFEKETNTTKTKTTTTSEQKTYWISTNNSKDKSFLSCNGKSI